MIENPGASNSTVPIETDESPAKAYVSGIEVPQAPSREVPDEIVSAVTEMHRISTESEKAQNDSGVEKK